MVGRRGRRYTAQQHVVVPGKARGRINAGDILRRERRTACYSLPRQQRKPLVVESHGGGEVFLRDDNFVRRVQASDVLGRQGRGRSRDQRCQALAYVESNDPSKMGKDPVLASRKLTLLTNSVILAGGSDHRHLGIYAMPPTSDERRFG